MDFQPQAMPGAVEKPLHATAAPACLVALVGKEIQNILMHLAARDFISQLIKSQLLSPLYGMIELAHRSIRPIFHVTFWPGINKIHVRFIGEVANTEALQDQVYALVLKLGLAPATTVYVPQHLRGQDKGRLSIHDYRVHPPHK